MWRISGALARAFNRFHVVNVNGCVHGEAEALGQSSLLPLGQNAGSKTYTLTTIGPQNDQNGQDQKRKGTYKSCTDHLPQHTVLDVFGWGAIAVFFLHLARQLSFQNAVPGSSPEDRCSRVPCLKQILASLAQTQDSGLKRSIIPKEAQASVWKNIPLQSEAPVQQVRPSDSASGYGILHLSADQDESPIDISKEGRSTTEISTDSKEASQQKILDLEEDFGESLQSASSRLLEVTENSMPVVLNIFGIVSARNSADYKAAFRFFRESAGSGYSKAQYNTGVCYEQGKGVSKDITKAAEYYLLAAKGGHTQAKYRYARYLLRPEAGREDSLIAIQMLQEAAQAGLKEAQAYLGVFYSKEPRLDLHKAVRYLRMAAENGDVQSRYYLGVCYEKGFGVPASRQEALRHYERASETGHGPAQQKMLEMNQELAEGESPPCVSLKAAASSPCLPVLDRVSVLTRAGNRLSVNRMRGMGLPHSLSTGNLLAMSTADTGNYSHVTNVSPPLTSLRAIGVG
ncbi:death ligand signal enhancer [Spea bombifrons]|uniref:death ligand signal enhancer n=1 Tax=Spea bombifrons TaxID=233779 RepID=UPI00234ADE60|nr:death ligand signal enhancer [Spea bombifrons]